MLDIIASRQFKRDLKLAKKRGCKIECLSTVVKTLAAGETLEAKYRDHALTENYAGFRECHVESDWLLVYKIKPDVLELYLFRTGTHSDLFR